MVNYITVASVRRTCGIGVSEISDADVTSTIEECEPEIERFYNTTFTPRTKIEVRDGNGTNRLILRRNPVMMVKDLYIDGTQEDTANLHIYDQSGKIELNSAASTSTFREKPKAIVIKYVWGDLGESTTDTTTSAASVAGTSVELAVTSETGFTTDDYVTVVGMDGYKESAKITATDISKITVDELVYSHVSGSSVILLEVNSNFTKLMNLACGIALVARIVGQSYTDIVGYGLGEFHVQKGEPYTQWRETANQLVKERDLIMSKLKPRPVVM